MTNQKKDVHITNLADKVHNLEQTQTHLIEGSGQYNYNFCDFNTYHKKGLKIHRRTKHGSTTCELCDETFKSARELKIHTYTHSLQIVLFHHMDRVKRNLFVYNYLLKEY